MKEIALVKIATICLFIIIIHLYIDNNIYIYINNISYGATINIPKPKYPA